MRRGLVIGWSLLGLLTVLLAVALAMVGSNLDQARIERDELKLDVDDLQQELDAAYEERETLRHQADERLSTLTQLQSELERVRTGQSGASAAGPTTNDSTATQASTSAPASTTP